MWMPSWPHTFIILKFSWIRYFCQPIFYRANMYGDLWGYLVIRVEQLIKIAYPASLDLILMSTLVENLLSYSSPGFHPYSSSLSGLLVYTFISPLLKSLTFATVIFCSTFNGDEFTTRRNGKKSTITISWNDLVKTSHKVRENFLCTTDDMLNRYCKRSLPLLIIFFQPFISWQSSNQ